MVRESVCKLTDAVMGASVASLMDQSTQNIKRKKAIVNVSNEGEYCFLWVIISAFYRTECHSGRVSSYLHYSRFLIYEKIQFPMSFKNIPKFEEMNTLRVHLFTLGSIGNMKNEVVPVFLSKTNRETAINLLVLHSKEEDDEAMSEELEVVDVEMVQAIRSSKITSLYGLRTCRGY